MGVGIHPTNIGFRNDEFYDFREKLANSIGLSYDDEGDTWNSDDPITIFLSTNDCGGVITPELLQVIAPRMHDIVGSWEDSYRLKKRGLYLAIWMEELGQAGVPMVLD